VLCSVACAAVASLCTTYTDFVVQQQEQKAIKYPSFAVTRFLFPATHLVSLLVPVCV
jgi:hypothetical protein